MRESESALPKIKSGFSRSVVFYRINRAFNRSLAAKAVVLDISKAFDGVCHTGLLHKLNFS